MYVLERLINLFVVRRHANPAIGFEDAVKADLASTYDGVFNRAEKTVTEIEARTNFRMWCAFRQID
jgi:hypothetical protein